MNEGSFSKIKHKKAGDAIYDSEAKRRDAIKDTCSGNGTYRGRCAAPIIQRFSWIAEQFITIHMNGTPIVYRSKS